MKTIHPLVLLILLTGSPQVLSSQTLCRADSVLSYQLVLGNLQPAAIEYFTYDDNDSLIKSTVAMYVDGNLIPGTRTVIERKKSKGKWVVGTYMDSWIPGTDTYGQRSKVTNTYDKKGNLLSTVYADELIAVNAGEGSSSFSEGYKTHYSYNKSGQLVLQLSQVRDQLSAQNTEWTNGSKMTYTYNEQGENTEITTLNWDMEKNNWHEAWRHNFSYDSLGVVSEMTTYEFINQAWVPKSRTEYGVDPSSGFKYTIVQKWDGAKSRWTNEFYYVMQLNELGKTKTEVHLSWTGKEWQITLTVHYEYNEAGEISRMLNDNNLVIMERYCR
jgi:hypothetical protein